SSDEADRKRKKLKIKAGLKRKRSGSDFSDSSEIDTKSIKLLISKLEKKVKKEESDEDSIPKKGKKKEKQLTPKEAAHEEYLSSDKIEVTPSKIHDMLGVPLGGYSLFDLDERETDHEFVRKWAGQFNPLELKKVRVNDIARKLIAAQDIDFLFKVNFLTLFTNTMDSTKFDKFPVVRTRLAIRNWSSYLMKKRQELELKHHVVGLLDLHDEWNEAEVQESEGFIGFSETSEKEVCGDDDENMDDDGGNVNNDVNGDSEDVNEGDKDPNGSNPSFGFSKISLEDFGNDCGLAEKDKAVEENTTEQGTVVEGNEVKEGEIMSTPESFTQWLEKNVDLVGEGYLFGDNSATLESMNQGITPEKLTTQKGSPSPKKRVVKASSYLLSPYMNKKTNSKSMFDGTLATFDAKWESFSNQVNAQFKGNKDGLALGGIDLKKLFARHLKLYGHVRHTQRDMLRRLRFKFATKILLHEINVHVGKMLELAKEFDKTDPVEKMAIIVDAFKKREKQESYEIPVESHEIQYESLEIHVESYEIQVESHESQVESQ
nr:hypothetical protein [Tanacetum cinerariifolium]